MRKYILYICIGVLSFINLNANNSVQQCHYGIRFELSDNPSWGYGELVITHTDPFSQAESLGLKKGDIIMEINGSTTYLKDSDAISSLLLDGNRSSCEFSIRNLDSFLKKIKLNKICLDTESIDEKGMSDIFSFYSLENVSDREFTLDLKIEANPRVDYTEYQTYDFVNSEQIDTFDKEIISSIDMNLRNKGMKRDRRNPDIVIQTYYSVAQNPQYNDSIAKQTDINEKKTWRYDSNSKSMIQLPIFTISNGRKYACASDIINFGISIYDRKQIDQEKLTQIWDAQIEDYSFKDASYNFSQYLTTHIPLILSQYPYFTSKDEVQFSIKYNQYNYTGLHFDTTDLSYIKDVDKGSPAFIAGIRPGHSIESIDDRKFLFTKKGLSDSYKLFITETMKYRDQSTKWTNLDGYTQAMYWDRQYTKEIADAFNEYKYLPLFAYLFKFESYVAGNAQNSMKFVIWNGSNQKELQIRPTLRSYIEIEVK